VLEKVLGMWGEVAQTMYKHVSKCKNYKIKGEKKKEFDPYKSLE
jgi:hypothetical protein